MFVPPIGTSVVAFVPVAVVADVGAVVDADGPIVVEVPVDGAVAGVLDAAGIGAATAGREPDPLLPPYCTLVPPSPVSSPSMRGSSSSAGVSGPRFLMFLSGLALAGRDGVAAAPGLAAGANPLGAAGAAAGGGGTEGAAAGNEVANGAAGAAGAGAGTPTSG